MYQKEKNIIFSNIFVGKDFHVGIQTLRKLSYFVIISLQSFQQYNLSQIMNTIKNVPNFEEVQNGVTWIGGTTHQLQKQHIPGYQGHVHGLFSENVHGKSFARVTAECMNGRNNKGIDIPLDNKYRTAYKQEYGQPDTRKNQFITTAQSILNRLQEQEGAVNKSIKNSYQQQPKSIEQVPPIDRVPVVGYMGFKAQFRKPIKEIRPPQQPPNVQLAQKKVLNEMLQTGSLNKDKFINESKPPIVGYGGFLPGVKAQNQYAQNFETVARNSKRL